MSADGSSAKKRIVRTSARPPRGRTMVVDADSALDRGFIRHGVDHPAGAVFRATTLQEAIAARRGRRLPGLPHVYEVRVLTEGNELTLAICTDWS